MSVAARFAAALDGGAGAAIGVAVSGGSDSLAVLHLAHDWAARTGARVCAATVDHGLRPAAASEAAGVRSICERLDIPHETLEWRGWSGAGNIQGEARNARYRLLAAWAVAQGLDVVLLGHTEDDLAETFLMRLARKSGVGGLSAMQAQFEREGVVWARPVLGCRRDDLREFLRSRSITWVDDPSNDDPVFDRVQTRKALRTLAPLGIDAPTIAASARALGDVKQAVVHYTRLEAAQRVTEDRGDLHLDLSGDVPPEIRRRLISAALHWFGRAPYPPRGASMAQLDAALKGAGQHTAAGVLVRKTAQNTLHMSREFNAVAGLSCATDQLWDGRWRVTGPHSPDLQLCALSEGIKDCPDWRDSGLSRASLMAAPAVWQGDRLIAVPILKNNPLWQGKIDLSFADFLLSH